MIKKLRKVGNSNALLLDKPILELLGLEEDGEVQLIVSEGSLIITPVKPNAENEARFQAALDQVIRTREGLLRKLSQ